MTIIRTVFFKRYFLWFLLPVALLSIVSSGCKDSIETNVIGTWVVDSVFARSNHHQVFLIANLMVLKQDGAEIQDETTNFNCNYKIRKDQGKYFIKFDAPSSLYAEEFEIKYWEVAPRRLIKLSNSNYEIYAVKMFD